MKNIIIGIVLLSILVLAGLSSCGQDDLQAEYDILVAQYEEAHAQLVQLQDDLAAAQLLQAQCDSQYDALVVQYDELSEQNTTNLGEIATMEARIDELESELAQLAEEIDIKINELADCAYDYDVLKAQYDAMVGAAAEVNEENIEQALFDLINQVRVASGLNELQIGPNLVNWALVNCQNMVVSKQLEQYTTHAVPFQRAFMATGYSSLDRLVNAAMTIWQAHVLSYEDNILAEDAAYGAVRVIKSDNIYYITFLASQFP
ncbi:MAG TPA: hypothetical protein G4O16_05945 [Dehalococcoidia bacterium]|nr:hypothetical protein [Dehalococcoidia bacterium]